MMNIVTGITTDAPADRTYRQAQASHEAERLAYLETLDPRQREDLDPDHRPNPRG